MSSADPATASARSTSSSTSPFIAFAVLPAFGHVYPVMPLAEAVRSAGARVQVAVGRPFEGALPLETALGSDVDVTQVSVPGLTRHQFPAVADDMAARWVPAYFGVAHALPTVTALRRAWRADRPDLVVYDVANPGAAVVADELGIPTVLFSVFHYAPPVLTLPAVTRRALEHPEVPPWEPLPAPAELPPYIDPVPTALQAGPIAIHHDVLPIRPVPWDDPSTAPLVLPRRRPGKPLLYVTLGTVAGTPDLLREIIAEAVEIGDVIASTGPGFTADEWEVPDTVAVQPFVSTRTVMAAADLVVHHGGMGSTLAAAAFGLPQLVLPQVGDQFANAQMVARAGIGQALVGPRAGGAIGAALSALADDPGTRAAAQALAHDVRAMPGPQVVADELIARATR